MTVSHPPGGRLPLLSARPAVTVPAAEHHRPLADTKLHCLVTEAHRCDNLQKIVTQLLPQEGFEPTTCLSQVQRSTRCATAPPVDTLPCQIQKSKITAELLLILCKLHVFT